MDLLYPGQVLKLNTVICHRLAFFYQYYSYIIQRKIFLWNCVLSLSVPILKSKNKLVGNDRLSDKMNKTRRSEILTQEIILKYNTIDFLASGNQG